MKKLFLICFAAFALTSCGDDGPTNPTENKPPIVYDKILLEDHQTSFAGYPATTTIRFESTADWRIKITSDEVSSDGSYVTPDWLTVEPMEGSAGNAEVTVKISPNATYMVYRRAADISIYAGNTMKRTKIEQKHLMTTIDNTMDPTYSSTDFSQDGETYVMQSANVGGAKAINIVYMGDGFTDRLIADGTYDNFMRTAMESFFSYEPYKSFRDYFTCHVLTLVSKDETIAEGHETALQTALDPSSTGVGGDNEKIIRYIYEKFGFEEMDDVMAVVVVNANSRHGTCHFYNQEAMKPDESGAGFTIAYSTLSDFRNTITHEGSHGFAKLDDEYVNNGVMTDDDKDVYENVYKPVGWFKNVDVTDDPEKIKWSHFLSDSRYASDDIGIFEGAAYCAEGAYRPSENSMMRDSYNGYGFNAPSREAIYYRIHRIAYGPEWEYDYEEFVKYDVQNIGESRKTRTRSGDGFRYVENVAHQSPVIHNKSWRDEIK